MKKIKAIIFTLLILLIALCTLINVNAESDEEALINGKGGTVYYYGTTDPVMIPKSYKEKTTEFRGTWVSFYAGDINSYQSKTQMMNQLNAILDTLEEYNMNTVVFHIRTHNNAYYDSELAPIAPDVKACNFKEWDYLEWFINECHKRGIEFHAWLNPYRISSVAISNEEIKTKYANFPNNPAHSLSNVLNGGDEGAILDPGIPEVREYINDVVMEIVNKYDVDAIHFDDYFYISGIDDSATRTKYNKAKLSIGDFRRSAVDSLIEDLNQSLKKYNRDNNKSVQLGISPTGVYRNGSFVKESSFRYDASGTLTYPLSSGTAGYEHYDSPLYCDTKKWVDNSWIDYVIPQCYSALDMTQSSPAAETYWWNGVVKNKTCKLYIGIGLYKMGTANQDGWTTNPDELLKQLRYYQKLENVDGVCVYEYSSLVTKKNTDALKALREEYWTTKAINPQVDNFMNYVDSNVSVENLKIYKSNDNTSVCLAFDKLENVYRYAIYKYQDKLDITDRKQIVGICGANKNSDYVSFTDYEYTENAKYAIIPITLANTLAKEKEISISDAKDFDLSVGEISIEVGEPTTYGGVINVIFLNPTIYVGTKGTFSIYVSYDENFSEYEVYNENSEYNLTGSNILRVPYNDKGMKQYIKVVCTNEYGSFESEVHEASLSFDAISLLDYIQNMNNEFYKGLFN